MQTILTITLNIYHNVCGISIHVCFSNWPVGIINNNLATLLLQRLIFPSAAHHFILHKPVEETRATELCIQTNGIEIYTEHY